MSDYKEVVFNSKVKVAAKHWFKDQEGGHSYLGIHGWMDNANSFDKLAVALKKDFIALDLPGHGKSEHRHPIYCNYIWEYALDLAPIVDSLNYSKVTLVGHSLGTSVCLFLANLFPEKIKAIYFIDGLGPMINSDKDWLKNYLRSYEFYKKLNISDKDHALLNKEFKTLKDAIIHRSESKIQSIPIEMAEVLVERNLKQEGGVYKFNVDPTLVQASLSRMNEEQLKSVINNIKCPITVFAAKNGLYPRDGFPELDIYKNIELHWVEGNHYPHLGESLGFIKDTILNSD